MAKRLKASYYKASTTTWTDFTISYKDSGGSTITSNALLDFIYDDRLHSPTRATLVLNNQSGSPFSNSSASAKTAFNGVLDRYNRIKVIDDSTKQIYFYGFVYEESATYDPVGGQRLKLVCYDFLKELQDTTTKGAPSYHINTGANNFASIVLNEAQASTSGVAVSNLTGRGSGGVWETGLPPSGSGYVATRGGLIKSLIAEHSRNINVPIAVTSPNTTRFAESVVDIFKANNQLYTVDDGEKPNILTHIQNLAVEDPHSDGSSAEGIFGYDYYLAPDFNSTLVTATPRDAYFNYFKRGTRPTASAYGPKAFGLNLELPSPDTITLVRENENKKTFQETGQRQPITSSAFTEPRNDIASSVTMDYPEYTLVGTETVVKSHTVEFERIEASSISGGDNFKWRDYRIESGTPGLSFTTGNASSNVTTRGSAERLKAQLTTLNADQSSTSNTAFTLASGGTSGFYVGQKVGIGSDATDIYHGQLDTSFSSSSFGEILTVSAINTNGTGITLTRGANATTYSSGDKVFALDVARIQYINRTGSYSTADIVLSHVDPHIDEESLYWGGARTWYGMTTTASSFVVADRPKTNHLINRKLAVSYNFSTDPQAIREKIAGYLQTKNAEITKGSVHTFRPPRTHFDNLVASIQSTSSTTQTFTLGKTPLTTQTTDNIDSSQTVITVADNSRFYNTQVIQIDNEKMTVSQAPPRITQLKGALSSASAGDSTSFDVDSTVGMVPNMIIRIDSEDLKITSVTDGDTVVATRGHNNTTATSHLDNTQVDEVGRTLVNVTRGSSSTSAVAHNTDYADIYAVDVNPQNYGVTEGMTVGKLDSNDAVTSYGYISAVDYSNRRVTVTWNTGTVSASDKIRYFVPVRAGDKIYVRDDTHNIDMEAILTKVRYDEMNGVALTTYNVEGYNDKHVSKSRSFPTGGSSAARGVPSVEFPVTGSTDDSVSLKHFTDPGEPVFTATDDDTIAWAKHEITVDNSITEIAGGSTSNMTAGKDYYIYHIKGSSTYTAADDVTYTTLIKDYYQSRLILIGIARASDDSNGLASFEFSKKVTILSPKKGNTVDINNIMPIVSGTGTSGRSGLNFITEAVTDLTGNVNETFSDSDTTLDVTSKGVASTEFPFWVGQVIKIDDEKLKVSSISGGANQLTVSRGFSETTLAAHANTTAIYGNYRHGSITPGYFNTSQRTIRIYTHSISGSGIDSKVQTVDFGQSIGLGENVEMLLSGSMELYVGSGTDPERIYWRTGGGGAEGSIHVDGGVLYVKNSSGTTTFASNSITTVGTITTGTWAATDIAIAHGGTGASTATAAFDNLSPMTAAGDILYGGTSGTVEKLAAGSAGQVLIMNSGSNAPEWLTASSLSGVASSGHAHATINVISGAVDAPSIEFVDSSGTGLYKIDANSIGFTCTDDLAGFVSATDATNGYYYTVAGYTWSGATTEYITRASNTISFFTGSTHRASINATSIIGEEGTTSLPAFSFVIDPDTGIYRAGGNQLGFTFGATARIYMSNAGLGSASSGTADLYVIGKGEFGGDVYGGGSVLSSDIAYKTNVVENPYGLDVVDKLKPKQYTFKQDQTERLGLIAQDVKEVLPDLDVVVGEEGTYSMRYESFIPILIKSIQELKKEIEELKENK